MDRRVVWHIGEDTSHREVIALVIADVLPDRILLAKDPLGGGGTEEGYIHLLQLADRIASQHLDTHRLEEERISNQDIQIREAFISPIEGITPTKKGTGGCLYLLREVGQQRPRRRPHVRLKWAPPLSTNRENLPKLIDPVILLEAGVKTLFIHHSREEQDAHRQSQSQGDHLDQVSALVA